ncbi:ATP-dependent protease, peptidase subunit HslV [Gottschalkia acidurici 9a]|uniref:ATP-dependent protease subunit HslV n=1 Tax=Gottschalkia acidurici (strain ATCC 7906 / DSM 604 / BCRC 14475 / CIP 104303 / KCTC 5404 / NCIMB 10678 / 9a) TaxID=1128398 RepID=K0B0M1_GOTA9|nr:ATP-dependent protease subunit HslV [Gottschalkia acidurici]AFS78617.1 ATP-dependent protease, peptidase subunit HslV [Gottschalkia acidurici 9a]
MLKGTTIIAVKKGEKIAIAGDGQVTMGDKTVMKHTAKKVRKLYDGKVIIGFAGTVSDALTLADKLEEKLEQFGGNLRRAAVELARDWRRDRVMSKLEAMLIAANKEELLVVSGTGEVIEPDDGIVAIGSGGSYALAAGKALLNHSNLDIKDVAKESLLIASSICVYTNSNISIEEL